MHHLLLLLIPPVIASLSHSSFYLPVPSPTNESTKNRQIKWQQYHRRKQIGCIAAISGYRGAFLPSEVQFVLVQCTNQRHAQLYVISHRNFRLADLVTIMNGVCGSLSVFMSAKYLVSKDEDYLFLALVFPVAGLIFDFMDGKIARWRKESSMLGQELDSLADLVRLPLLPALCRLS